MTYSPRAERTHNALQRLLVLFDEDTQLFVVVQQTLVFCCKRYIHAFELSVIRIYS